MQSDWFAWRLATKHWNRRPGCRADHLGHLPDRPLREPAAGLKRQRLGGDAELEDDVIAVLLQRRQEQLLHIRRINIPFRRAGLRPPRQGGGHFGVAHRQIVDVGRDSGGGGNDQVVRKVIDVVFHGGVNVVERVDRSVGRRTLPAADGRGELGVSAPRPLQFVQSGVELAPLRAGEEAPFGRVLQPGIVFAATAPGALGARAADVQPVENRVPAAAVVGPLADHRVEPPPVVGGDRLAPIVEVFEDQPQPPRATRVADYGKIRKRAGDALPGFLLRRPTGELRQPRPVGATGRVEIADDHVVKHDVVQPAGAQMAAHQVRMHVEHGQFGQGFFQLFH